MSILNNEIKLDDIITKQLLSYFIHKFKDNDLKFINVSLISATKTVTVTVVCNNVTSSIDLDVITAIKIAETHQENMMRIL